MTFIFQISCGEIWPFSFKDPTKDCGNSILGVNSFSDQIIEASESNHVPTKDQTKVIQDKSDQVKNKK